MKGVGAAGICIIYRWKINKRFSPTRIDPLRCDSSDKKKRAQEELCKFLISDIFS